MNNPCTFRQKLCLLFFFASLFPVFQSHAQCPAPQYAGNVTVTQVTCPGNGKIEVSLVSPAVTAPDVYQFALFTADGQEVKSWQSDSTLRNLDPGSYYVYVRRVCASGVSDTLRLYASLVSLYRPVQLYGVYPSNAINCCNGNIYVDAFELSAISLVNSLNAPDIPANYVRPKQTNDPQFLNLCAGTYYVRIYDACDNYITRSVDIGLETRTYTASDISRRRISCDTLQFDYQISNTAFPGTTWIEWPDGTADTSRAIYNSTQYGQVSAHLSKLSTAYNPALPFPSSVPAWPVSVKIGFRDDCGTVTRYDRQIAEPGVLQARIEQYDGTRCDSVTYMVYLSNGPWGQFTSWAYTGKNVTYSVDGGTTWAPLENAAGTNRFTVHRGQTYNVLFAFCGDTLSQTLTVPDAPPFLVSAAQLRGTGCEADIYAGAANPTGTLKVEMIQAPAGVSPFPTGTPTTPGSSTYVFKNLPFGTYTFRITDSSANCFRSEEVSATLQQVPLGIKLRAENVLACKDRARIGFYPTGNGGNTISDDRPMIVKVLQQPAGAGIPATFTVTDWHEGVYFPGQLQNIIPGDYAFEFLDTTGACPRTTSASITIPPDLMLNTDFSVTYTCDGKARVTTASGYQYLSEFGQRYVQPFQGYPTISFVTPSGTVLTPMRTGMSYNFPTGQTTYEFSGLTAQTYTIRLQLPESDTLQPGCSATEKVVTLGVSPLTLNGARFLAGCAGSAQSATLTAPAQGGSGAYTYSLYQGSVAADNLVAGPQASSVFNNLNANTVYVVEVTDECGSATRLTTSTADASIPVFASSSQVCPGENVTLSLDAIPGATYQWTKNGTVLAGQNANQLSLPAVQYPADTGSYQVTITLGSCVLLSNTSRLTINCTPTPVVLIGFTAVNDGNQARLDWSTSSETKNLGFDIQRSIDGKIWERLGFVASQATGGSTNRPLKYTYRDAQVVAPTQYYRLKQIDLDGKTEFSAARSVAFSSLAWQAYPNPASRVIVLHRVSAGARVTVTDINGREFHSGEQAAEGTYRIERVPVGLYLLTVRELTGGSRSEKVFVTH